MREFGGAMRVLAGVGAVVLAPPAASADCGPAALETAVLERVAPDGALELRDGRRLRLAGLHAPAAERSHWPRPGDALAIGLLDAQPDRWGRLPSLVFTVSGAQSPQWLQQRLIHEGAALARPEAGLGACWDLLRAVEAGAQPWNGVLPVEAGRFARVTGRVARVGEGRSARFITLFEPGGARVTGLVQKRHLARLKQAGVDVEGLRGHVIRLRGTRSATNPTVIPVMAAEQIEIVR